MTLQPVVLDGAGISAPGQSSVTTVTQAQPVALDRVLRNMAGVSTQGGTPDDPEIAVSIRGLQDYGRVAVTLDGARLNFGRAGHGANGTFSVDPEMLREISVTRGLGAGAGAIAGAVAMRTIVAGDLITEGETQGGEARLRYGRFSKSPSLHLGWAARLGGDADVTIAAGRSETGDYRSGDYKDGGRQTVAAGQLNRSGLLKFGWRPDDAQSLTFGVNALKRRYITALGGSSPYDTDYIGRNYVLDYSYTPGSDLVALKSAFYVTTTRIGQQRLTQDLQPTGIFRSYETETRGMKLTNTSVFETGALSHSFELGLEAFEDRVKTHAEDISLTPSGQRRVWALSATDVFMLGETEVTLGLTFDGFRLSSEDGSNSGTAISPRLALSRDLGAGFTLSGSAGTGYRPPSLSESLVDGAHPGNMFLVEPNPNLRAEKAKTFEIGLAYEGGAPWAEEDQLMVRANVFRNKVGDYIDMVEFCRRAGVQLPPGTTCGLFDDFGYRYENTARVRLQGIELEAEYQRGIFFAGLSAQRLQGKDLQTGASVTRISPDRAVLTAGLRPREGDEYGLRVTSVAARPGGISPAESWTTVDLFATRQIGTNTVFALSLNNITDEAYTPHLEARPAPGINMQASLSLRF